MCESVEYAQHDSTSSGNDWESGNTLTTNTIDMEKTTIAPVAVRLHVTK